MTLIVVDFCAFNPSQNKIIFVNQPANDSPVLVLSDIEAPIRTDADY